MFNIKTHGRFQNIYVTDDASFSSNDVIFNPRVCSVSVPNFNIFNIETINYAQDDDYLYIDCDFGADWKDYLVSRFGYFLDRKLKIICRNPPCKYFHSWFFISDGHYIQK